MERMARRKIRKMNKDRKSDADKNIRWKKLKRL